jgi:hypothetical protein
VLKVPAKQVTIQMLEIYNEQVRDLFAKTSPNGIYVSLFVGSSQCPSPVLPTVGPMDYPPPG